MNHRRMYMFSLLVSFLSAFCQDPSASLNVAETLFLLQEKSDEFDYRAAWLADPSCRPVLYDILRDEEQREWWNGALILLATIGESEDVELISDVVQRLACSDPADGRAETLTTGIHTLGFLATRGMSPAGERLVAFADKAFWQRACAGGGPTGDWYRIPMSDALLCMTASALSIGEVSDYAEHLKKIETQLVSAEAKEYLAMRKSSLIEDNSRGGALRRFRVPDDDTIGPVITSLRDHLNAGDIVKKKLALMVLFLRGSQSEAAIPDILTALEESDDNAVKQLALLALGSNGGLTEVQSIGRYLDDPNLSLATLTALSMTPIDKPEVLEAWAKSLQAKQLDHAVVAVVGIGQLEAEAADWMPHVLAFVKRYDDAPRRFSFEMPGDLKISHSRDIPIQLPFVVRRLEHARYAPLAAGLYALHSIVTDLPPEDAAYVRKLVDSLRGDGLATVYALRLLEKATFGSLSHGEKLLVSALEHEDAEVRVGVVRLLGVHHAQIEHDVLEALVIAALEDESSWVRMKMLDVLATNNLRIESSKLANALEREENPLLVKRAQAILAANGAANP